MGVARPSRPPSSVQADDRFNPDAQPMGSKAFKIRPASRFGVGERMIVLGAIVAMILTYLLVRFGILSIPLVSDWLYHGPTPDRIIQTQPVSWQVFHDSLAQRVNEQGEISEGVYRLDITEQELTGVLESTAQDALRNQAWNLRSVQVAVTPDHLQLWLKIDWGWHAHLDLLLDFKPEVDGQGALRFVIERAQVGDYHVPAAWGLRIGSFVFSRDLGDWEMRLGGKSAVRSISLQPGIMTVILSQ